MVMLVRKAQYLAKIQTVEGTAETLAAADGKTRINVGGTFEPQAPPIKRDLARDTLSPIGLLVGEKGGGITVVSEMNTPDVMTGLPEQEATLRSGGITITPLRRIPIGAIATGPVARGATMTGTTSGATGRVVKDTVNGESHVHFAPISGTFQAEALTFTGGASATSSAVSAVYGARGNPNSTYPDTITAEYQNDGFAWSVRDAMSNIAFDVEASKQGFWKMTPMGAKSTWGTKAMTTSIAFDTGNPPQLQDASLRIGSFAPVFSKVGFDMNSKVVYRRDGNAVGNTGIKAARINDRDPSLKITCEHELAATFDFFGSYDALTTYAIKFQIGTVIGKRIFFFAAAAQLANPPSLGDLDGIRGLELEFLLTSLAAIQGSDGEFEILWI
ncbi:MAG: hypothetical protein ABIW76_14400 [Fibrobacteria bacterium]